MGVKEYDWGGMASYESPNGINKFRMSFGGEYLCRDKKSVRSEISDTGRAYPFEESDCPVQYFFSEVQRSLRKAGCSQWNNGAEGGSATGRHCQTWSERDQPDMAERKVESSRTKEGKNPGK